MFNDEDKVVAVLDDRKSCMPSAAMSNYCGGCDSCLLMQADHAKMRVESETIPFEHVVGLMEAAQR